MKRSPNKILMDLDTFKLATDLAQIGIGNRAIERDTGLSNGQITYRCGVYKKGMELKEGLRVGWRNGKHPLLRRVLADVRGVMDREFERRLLPQFVHPTPEIVKGPKRSPISIDRAVKLLKARKVGWI